MTIKYKITYGTNNQMAQGLEADFKDGWHIEAFTMAWEKGVAYFATLLSRDEEDDKGKTV